MLLVCFELSLYWTPSIKRDVIVDRSLPQSSRSPEKSVSYSQRSSLTSLRPISEYYCCPMCKECAVMNFHCTYMHPPVPSASSTPTSTPINLLLHLLLLPLLLRFELPSIYFCFHFFYIFSLIYYISLHLLLLSSDIYLIYFYFHCL